MAHHSWAAVGSGLSKATILTNTLAEFDANHTTNKSIDEPEDKIGAVVDTFMSQLDESVK